MMVILVLHLDFMEVFYILFIATFSAQNAQFEDKRWPLKSTLICNLCTKTVYVK